jgi:hypothetical protein
VFGFPSTTGLRFSGCPSGPVAGSLLIALVPVTLQVPLPVPSLIALVYSLLLEDCSSVELNNTRTAQKY